MIYNNHNPFHAAFDSLEEFADMISDVLQCPVTIEDANHRLLAYSTHDERTDPARISTIIGRRVPEKVINSLWKEGVIPALLTSKHPLRIKSMEDIGLSDRVAVSIWKNDEVLGFIWALEIDRALAEPDFRLLQQAAETAKNKLLQLQARKHKKEERSQEFFWKLLTNHMERHEEIIEQFHSLQITPSPSFAVMLLQFEGQITREEEKQISYLLQTSQHLKILLHTIDGRQLILLTSLAGILSPPEEMSRFAHQFIHHMEKRFGITSITPAFSSVHEQYEYVGRAYKETLTVLSMKEKFPSETAHIHSYDKLGIYQLIDIVRQHRKQENYENRALKKLREYDQKHGSNLIETLDAFFNKDQNVNDAAKALSVHTNTLTYRLKRISEIGSINLKDPNEKMLLYFDMKLETFQNR